MTALRGPFEQLVFAGGGLRCFWQGGLLHVLRAPLGLAPARISAVSGGALSAAAFIARRGEAVLEAMIAKLASVDSNIAWDTPADDGLTPHQRLYREVVAEAIDEAAEGRIADGPPFQVLLAHPPASGWPKTSGTLAALAYEAHLHSVGSPHGDWAGKVGASASLVDARAAARDGRLVDLIASAAAIPPVFEPPVWDGRPVIDGGIVDQAPMPDPDAGRTLVLLTRRYRSLPETDRHVYLSPNDETPADKIDFTDARKVRATYDCGVTDGRNYITRNTAEY